MYRLNTICNFERISAPDPERSPFSSVQCYRVSCLVRWKTKHTWGYLKVHWILKRKSSWLTALKLIRLSQLCAKRNLSVSMVENIYRSTHSVSLEDHHHLAVHLAPCSVTARSQQLHTVPSSTGKAGSLQLQQCVMMKLVWQTLDWSWQANSQIPSVFNSTQHAHAPNSRKTTRLHRTATLQIGFHDNSQTYMVGWHQMLIAMDAAERSIEAVRRFKEACPRSSILFYH